jgi:predicted N-acyltransferase
MSSLKSLARRHDLVVIHISDKRETKLPKLGIVPVIDKESKKTLWINTSFGDFRDKIGQHHEERKNELVRFSRKHQINFISIDTDDDYVPKLLKLFKVRNQTMKT